MEHGKFYDVQLELTFYCVRLGDRWVKPIQCSYAPPPQKMELMEVEENSLELLLEMNKIAAR